MRIVSLLPSATEIICCLGLQDQLVGVTHECDFPDEVTHLPRVTRSNIPVAATSSEIDVLVREQVKSKTALYSLDLPTLESLRPDLIVTQALCDVCAVAEEDVRDAVVSLPATPRVINLEPTSLEELFQAIAVVGEAANCSSRAGELIASLRHRVSVIEQRSSQIESKPTVLLLEWIDPPFSAGHWNPELVRIAGGRNAIGEPGQRSRCVTWEEIRQVAPDVLVIACCGFDVERTLVDLPILQSQSGWDDLRAVKAGRVFVEDGSAYFNRPGPRLIDSLEILADKIHPSPP